MFTEVNGMNLFYQKTGDGSPLILLHGNGEDHHIFDKAVDVLKAHFTVYAVDTRGHGQSSPIGAYHYDDMAGDIHGFILHHGLAKPILYGFSDGGIVGLLLAAKHPGLLSRLIISGANTHPFGLKWYWLCLFRAIYALKRSPQFKMMLEEPDITIDMLRSITVPTYITAGSRDIISGRHTQSIHENIPGSSLKIFSGENHGSYIIGRDKIARYLIDILVKRAE